MCMCVGGLRECVCVFACMCICALRTRARVCLDVILFVCMCDCDFNVRSDLSVYIFMNGFLYFFAYTGLFLRAKETTFSPFYLSFNKATRRENCRGT